MASLVPFMQYVKRIDGLRGLAVLAVLFYHLNLPVLKGGFIGVDIFFVISGFLITGVIQSSLANSGFSFITFYLRRIKRLLPALYLMLLVTAVLAVLFFLPHEIKSIYQGILVTTVYVANTFNYSRVNYFNTFYNESPLLHTWSLSIEEQFYLLYPLSLFLMRNLTPKKRIIIIAALVLASFAASFYFNRIDGLYTFYYPQFRVWELGLGSLTFLVSGNLPSISKINRVLNSGITYYLAIVTILLSIFFCRADFYIPSLGALPAVFATCIILRVKPSRKVFADILESSVFIFFGLISYSLYLWHQPVLAVMYKICGGLNFINILTGVLLSVLIAFLSWRFVEKPIRNSNTQPLKVFGYAAGFSVLLILLGLYGNYTNGFMKYFINKMPPNSRGWFIQRDSVFKKRYELWRAALKKNSNEAIPAHLDYLIIGDSKGQDMNACFYANDYIRKNYTFHYLQLREADMGNIADAILNKTTGQWIAKHNKENGYKKKYNLLSGLDTMEIKNVIFTCTWQRSTNYSVAKLVKLLSKKVPHTFVVSTANWNDVTSLSYGLAKTNMTYSQRKTYLYNNLRDDFKRQGDELHGLLSNVKNVTWVNKEDAFCDMKIGECDLFNKNKSAYIYDTGHLTFDGAKYFGTYILNHKWFNLGRDSAAAPMQSVTLK